MAEKPKKKPKKKPFQQEPSRPQWAVFYDWARSQIELLTKAYNAIPGKLASVERNQERSETATRASMESLNNWATRFDKNWNKEIVVLRNQLIEMDARWHAVKAMADETVKDVKTLQAAQRSTSERVDEVSQRINNKWWVRG